MGLLAGGLGRLAAEAGQPAGHEVGHDSLRRDPISNLFQGLYFGIAGQVAHDQFQPGAAGSGGIQGVPEIGQGVHLKRADRASVHQDQPTAQRPGGGGFDEAFGNLAVFGPVDRFAGQPRVGSDACKFLKQGVRLVADQQ